MRTVPERSGGLQVLTVLGGFLLGPFCAVRLGAVLTPGSQIVQTVAPFAFASVFAGGIVV
jgi:hypothetical protein